MVQIMALCPAAPANRWPAIGVSDFMLGSPPAVPKRHLRILETMDLIGSAASALPFDS